MIGNGSGRMSPQEYWQAQMNQLYGNRPEELAKKKAHSEAVENARIALQNPIISEEYLIQYAMINSTEIIDMVIDHQNTTEKVLMSILNNPDLQLNYKDIYIQAMISMAERKCNANLFKRMNFALDYRVIDVALRHNAFTEEVILTVLDYLDNDNYDRQLTSIHKSGKETVAIWNKYVSMKNSVVHSFIVDLPNCSPELLAYLTKNDKKLSLNRKILQHPNCNADVLFAVSEHDDYQLLLMIIQHPKCPTNLVLSIKEKDQVKRFMNRDVYEIISNHFETTGNPMPMKLAYEVYLKSGCSLGMAVDRFIQYYNDNPQATIDFLEDISMEPDLATGGKTREFLEYFLRIKPEVKPHIHFTDYKSF